MKTYTTKDGAQFQAVSHSEFLRLMRKDSWDPRDSDLAFREATARAASVQTGQEVSAASDEALVEGLLAAGLVWISEDGKEAGHD
jgi:hypothetical protein